MYETENWCIKLKNKKLKIFFDRQTLIIGVVPWLKKRALRGPVVFGFKRDNRHSKHLQTLMQNTFNL